VDDDNREPGHPAGPNSTPPPNYPPYSPYPPGQPTQQYPPVPGAPQDTSDRTQMIPTIRDEPPQPNYQSPNYPPNYPPPGQGSPEQPTSTYPPVGGPGGYGQPAAGYGQQPQYDQYGQQQPAQYEQPGQYGQQPTGYQPAGYQPAAYEAQPQYNGPASHAANDSGKKSHAGLWTLLVVAIVIIAIAAVTFIVKPSFLFKKVLDHSAVEQTIEQQSAGSATPLTNVTCPSNEKVKAGTTFQCTAANNKKVTVTIKDSKANYQWSLAS
jgi:Domain of unknown function (DUF4333)